MPASPFLRLWLLVVVIAVSWQLGGYPLLDADEGRNGEVAREMAVTNDYVLPRLNTLPYLDKPIVYFAVAAAAMEILGPTELAARLPALLFTFLTAALLAWFARRIWGESEGWAAAIVFLSMPLTLAFARTVIFDSALTFFVVVAIIAFYEAITGGDKRWSIVAWAAIGFGVITKGPVAIVVPLLIAVPFAIRQKAFRRVWSAWGVVAFSLIIAPWLWAVSLQVPDFLSYVLVTETAERLATKALQRTGPPWYFVPYLLFGALPWSIVALFGLTKQEDETQLQRDARLYMILWVVVPFLFFSISQSKRPQYILPLMPAVALLAVRAWRSARLRTAARSAAVFLLFFGVVLLIAPMFPELTRKMKPVIVEPARTAAFVLGAAFVAGGLAALAAGWRRAFAVAALTIPVLAIPLTTTPLMRALTERRSAKSLADQIAPHLTPQTRVIGVEAFTGSMAFYLQRPILLASDDATELTSNYLVRRYQRLLADPRAPVRPVAWFEKTLDECCAPRVYVLRNNDRNRRTLLEGRGMRRIATGEHHVAYVPSSVP